MKRVYIKPQVEVIDFEIHTIMMAQSQVDTGIGNTPSEPDAPGRRGQWGNLWDDNDQRYSL